MNDRVWVVIAPATVQPMPSAFTLPAPPSYPHPAQPARQRNLHAASDSFILVDLLQTDAAAALFVQTDCSEYSNCTTEEL